MNAVCFSRPMLVTNSRCCSDSHTMCENCAREALLVNVPPARNRLSAEERQDILEIPTINYRELVASQRAQAHPLSPAERAAAVEDVRAKALEDMEYELQKENLRRIGASPGDADVRDMLPPAVDYSTPRTKTSVLNATDAELAHLDHALMLNG